MQTAQRNISLTVTHQPARFTFAHLARCAAAIRFLPAAEIVRFGLAALTFAHRAFCARLILGRAAAGMVGRDAPAIEPANMAD
jgi:hypothetical protein